MFIEFNQILRIYCRLINIKKILFFINHPFASKRVMNVFVGCKWIYWIQTLKLKKNFVL